MVIHLGVKRAGEQLTSLGARARRIHHNLRCKVPYRAQLAHLWSVWGDESVCDGCGFVIEETDIEFELQFGRDASTTTIRLHRDCWEVWRAHELEAEPELPISMCKTLEPRWYLCTRHSDGRVVRGAQTDLRSAGDALTTFLGTARRLGYRIEPPDASASPEARYVARKGTARLIFWIGEADEPMAVIRPGRVRATAVS